MSYVKILSALIDVFDNPVLHLQKGTLVQVWDGFSSLHNFNSIN